MTTSTARVLLDGSGGDGTITGVDPEGCDLRRERQIARLDFATPAAGPRRAGAAG